MLNRISLALFATSTFLTPLQVSLAQEANAGGCSIMTIVSDAGEITWNTDEAAAELISIAKETNLTPEQAHEACHGEAVTQQAESDEAVEEEKVDDVASSEELVETDESDQSDGIGVSALLPLAALGLGGGGGGGGGGGLSDGQYRNTVGGDYATEYNANDALAYQNILSLNDYGYTGAGIKVSVVDTGIDASHQEFDSKTIYGQDFASSASGSSEDENGHGTFIAAIIAGDRDATGVRGMAYDATLYSYKVDNDGDSGFEGLSSDAAIANIFNQHVSDDIVVSNNSWGGSTAITATSEAAIRAAYPSTITAMRSAQTNGTIIIFASGNDSRSEVDSWGGSPYYITELVNEWLAVTSVDSDGTEAYYTNRCGVSSAFCVTAVGGDVTTAAGGVYSASTGTNDGTNNNYERGQGTSYAAPHVSGLAAALSEKFPSLTAAQIVTRIKNGASYDGLTGRGGETTANSTTAQLQAIFGHGLINSTTSAAAFGNYIYANGSDLADGTNVSATKISLPAGLPQSVQNQILAGNFIVFDSFDGARFSVHGSQVFSTSSSTTAPSFSSTDMIDTHNDPSFGFISANGGVKPSNWMPRFIASGTSDHITASKGFWGETASLFPTMSMLQAEPSTSYIWNQTYDGVSVQPFIQFRDEYDNAKSISGYGTSFNVEFDNGFKLATGYKVANNLMNNGIMEDASSNGHLAETELGFVQKISKSDDVFFRMTSTTIDDVNASDKTFGFQNAKADSWTLGYSTQGKFGNFAWGVSKANQLSKGTVSLITPTGRTRTGDVLYTEQQFALQDDVRLERFFAYKYDYDDASLSFGLVEDKYDYGNIGAAKLNFSMQF